jgi:RimJ/RimL family protein N-acetyltransferase
VVFQAFEGGAAEMHFGMMKGHTMGPELVQGIFMLAFHPRAFGLRTLFAPIHETNIPAQVAALKVGFKFEYRKPAITPGAEDAIVFSMRRWEASGETAAYETQSAKTGE